MNFVVLQWGKSPIYHRAIYWFRLISITGTAQVLIQAIGFVSGILIIRLLPTHEYALYTLANTVLGTMTILSDGGISSSVMAQGGGVWQDREKLGTVLSTAFALRRKFAALTLLVAIPFLLYLCSRHNASWLMSVLLLLSIVPAFLTTVSGNLFTVGPSLHQAITSIQKTQIGVSLGRLLLLTLTVFVFPWAFIAILAAGVPQFWANTRLRKLSAVYADSSQKPNKEIGEKMVQAIKRILPGSIYYCLSGQITIWLISIYGTTIAVAQIGALGRISMILSLFNVLFVTLVVPRFARLPSNKTVLLQRYLLIQGVLLLVCLSLLAVVWLFPSQILWILGQDYSNLEIELLLNIMVACLAFISGLSFNLSACRGWIIKPLISIPVTVFAIIVSAALIDISTLQGVLIFSLVVSLTEVVMYLTYCILRITKTATISATLRPTV